MIRPTCDPEADALNAQFGPNDAPSDDHRAVAPGIYVGFDREGHPIGIEVTSVHLPKTAKVAAAAKDAAA
jgi:hypothetical protein